MALWFSLVATPRSSFDQKDELGLEGGGQEVWNERADGAI